MVKKKATKKIATKRMTASRKAADNRSNYSTRAAKRTSHQRSKGSAAANKSAKPNKTTAVGDGERNGETHWLTIVGARHNNLKNVDVRIPLGRFVCVTGVSGSGKSSLVNDILYARLARDLNGAEKHSPGEHDDIVGIDSLDKVIDIDQTPIGRTPRSNPATYIKVFDLVRSLFAETPDAKVRGYKPGRFSFNVPTGAKGGGRCEGCEGNGATRMDMDFLADVWVRCPVCEGRRFNRETLQITFKGKHIADVLNMDAQEALAHFGNIPKIASMLQTLHDVGLDYLKLGQSSTTLSGGEAQRIKLARELVKRSTGQTLYLLDEPTTGLHFADIKRLLAVLHGFVDAGNTVVVIEHNLDVIKTADWVIDLGPEGGESGGEIVVEGTPEQVAACRKSATGQSLTGVLKPRKQGANGAAIRSAGRTRSKAKTKSNGSDRVRDIRIRDIRITGARQHNLKNIDTDIPRERMTVFCGPSGSGKTSLAMDTICAEGQRRYVESLSAYARQFVNQMQKPQVEKVEGLSPAISIEQKSASKSPRSTVGTVTEVYDYMRVLWTRLGEPHCPTCDIPIGTQTSDEIVERVMAIGEGVKAMVLAPIQRSGAETYQAMFDREKSNGFARVRVDGEVFELDKPVPIDHRRRHDVELVVDRVIIRKKERSRIAESVEQALAAGAGVAIVQVIGDPSSKQHSKNIDLRFSQQFSCDHCGRSYEELTPHHFSFNNRMGWCDACEGLGVQRGANPAAIVTHPTQSLLGGAIGAWGDVAPDSLLDKMVRSLARSIGFDPDAPYNQLTEAQKLTLLHGAGDTWIDVPEAGGMRVRWRGFFPAIDRATRASWQFRKRLEDLVTDVACERCRGSRLRPEARMVRLAGQSIADVCALPMAEALAYFKRLRLRADQKRMAGELLSEIVSRITFLVDVGLEYVSLNRSAPTLSGGESQRIRLASQLGSGLTGVLYVLDEPTIGLHPRDNARLIAALQRLRDLGNTLIMVEHDREVIDSADHVMDFGPGAGAFGGEVTAHGTPRAIRKKKESLSGQYLSGKQAIAVPSNRRPVREIGKNVTPDRWLTVRGAYHNNLKDVDVAFPLGRLICVTGVSGSGKSSLVTEILHKALASRIHRARLTAGGHHCIEGIELIDKVINVDQSPIGNSPSSNPATYTGVFDSIRDLFTRLPASKIRGYTAKRFSFNRPGGRCEACEGNGQRLIEMHFLPDVWVTCEACGGKRYTAETLEVRYHGKSIADVLEMRVSDALELFGAITKIRRMLKTLDDVGLGYVQLGQPAPTLSGGEAQRVRLAGELGRPATGKTLYILDEPTTGLHFDDLRKLLDVLHRLVDLGNTVVCIEHNLDVIKNADWIIDMGPEAGDAGGDLVATCAPEDLIAIRESHTAKALAPVLAAGPLRERAVFDAKAQAAVEAELQGPLKLESDDDTKMPWQIDGRKWHLDQRLDHHGKPIQWEPAVLKWIIDTVEKLGAFSPTDWNNPSRVEIKAPGAKTPWLLHALTRGTMLLDVSLRAPSGAFDIAELRQKLNIASLDDRDDLPVYGGSSRVQMRRVDKAWDNIRIVLHDFKDVNKTAFKAFLKQCAGAYFEKINATADEPAGLWESNPKAWHLTQGALKQRSKKARWKASLLPELIGLFNRFHPRIDLDFTRKVMVALTIDRIAIVSLVTNMPQGIRVEFRVGNAAVTPTQIERLGVNPEIVQRATYDTVRFWVRRIDDIDKTQLKLALNQALAHCKTSGEKTA